MRDKIKCSDDKCPLKDHCERFQLAQANTMGYFVNSPRKNTTCRFFEGKLPKGYKNES